MSAIAPSEPLQAGEGAWTLRWLTESRAWWTTLGLVAAVTVFHLLYIAFWSPMGLTGDEAHYWEWSRRLDWSYYSKGPLVAWLIRGSCAVFGDTEFGVRFPAPMFAAAIALCIAWLARRLSGSSRTALGAVVLAHLTPLFAAGSMLMTIDPPFMLCWALACCLAFKAAVDGSRAAWIGIGIAAGVGFLAKYAMYLWLGSFLAFLAFDPSSRRWLKTPWPWICILIATCFAAPVVAWNIRHGWASVRHVSHQTGVSHGVFSPGDMFEFLKGEIAIVNPPVFYLMVSAVIWAMGRTARAAMPGAFRRGADLLLWCGLPLFALTLASSVLAKAQLNWPAPTYITVLALTAAFLATRLHKRESWWYWRGWLWAAAAVAVVVIPLAHDSRLAYPLIEAMGKSIRESDPTAKFSGYRELAQEIDRLRKTMPAGTMVICEDYQTTAEMAFYLSDRPVVFCAGPYLRDPKRLSQYDLWPDHRLDDPALFGKSALYIGHVAADMEQGFATVKGAMANAKGRPTPEYAVRRGEYVLRTFKVWRCTDFHGLKLSTESY